MNIELYRIIDEKKFLIGEYDLSTEVGVRSFVADFVRAIRMFGNYEHEIDIKRNEVEYGTCDSK